MTQRSTDSTIRFDATLSAIDRWTILRLPRQASERLPSRGQVAVRGTINGHAFQAVLEPDGSGGHWLEVDRKLRRMARVGAGDEATVEIEVNQDWPEPKMPRDFEAALEAAPQKIQEL